MAIPLPLEICRHIVDHLHPMYDNPTLAILARTSRSLHPIAERQLYNSLYLLGARLLYAVLQSFTSRPILASYPRQIYVRPSERERTPQNYWSQLSELLKVGGASLELLCIIGNDHDASYSWVLRSMRDAHGNLAVLRCPFWWDTEIATFLESDGARGLTRLETGDIPGGAEGTQQVPSAITLHRDAAANLTIIEAPPSALMLLVPGRPITHVRLRLGPATTLHTLPPVDHLLADCLARSTAPKGVIAVDVGDLTHAHRMETYSLELMELVPRFLPNLRFIGTVNYPWLKDIPVGVYSTTRLHKPLIRLPELHTLELVVSHIHPSVDSYWELATASELRIFSTSLRELVFYKGYDRHRWVWVESESDFVLAPPQDQYPHWGGL
ncbi:hypothetical protein K439DRAFT_1636876 [Ramaria rubella]|nr:hypothetical protein K439DRAFT_1636876 [Ramaria rubella]